MGSPEFEPETDAEVLAYVVDVVKRSYPILEDAIRRERPELETLYRWKYERVIDERAPEDTRWVAAYLLNAGHTVDEVIGLYAQRPDFDERVARYQVEHIAGLRGSRTKYTVPSCQTMRTHGLCVENGRLCPVNIKNPMQYASRKEKESRKS
ncbi:MAG: hypothetical protein ABDH63_05990 [Candidatus Caldarchaeales archaeon]